MIENPMLQGKPGKIDYASMYTTFVSSLNDVVARSKSKEAVNVIAEFAQGRTLSGQAKYVECEDREFILCRVLTRGAFSHAAIWSALLLFDMDGQARDVLLLDTGEQSSNEAVFLDDANDDGGIAEFRIQGIGARAEGSFRHEGKYSGFPVNPGEGAKGRVVRIGVKAGKFVILSGI